MGAYFGMGVYLGKYGILNRIYMELIRKKRVNLPGLVGHTANQLVMTEDQVSFTVRIVPDTQAAMRNLRNA